MKTLLIAALAAFNLECSGVSQFGTAPQEPFQKTFRVDLDAGRWCENDCKRTWPFFAITDDALIFQAKVDRISSIREQVDRQSGEYTAEGRALRSEMRWQGRCVRADFTGMPPLTRQF